MKALKRIMLFLMAIVSIAVIVFIGVGYNKYIQVLHENPLATKIDEIKNNENYITLDQLPKDYLNAVVAVEDRRFYDHGAIDVISIGRAIFTNIKNWEISEGGSTLTQQLSKNLYFTFKADPIRKIAEVFMAFTIENNYSKDEILELYVNTCYFGSGYYGIKEACLGYFNKEPKDMTLDESTLIAGIPNAPSIYGLNYRPDLARKRQKHVLKSMVTNNYISQEDADKVINSIQEKETAS